MTKIFVFENNFTIKFLFEEIQTIYTYIITILYPMQKTANQSQTLFIDFYLKYYQIVCALNNYILDKKRMFLIHEIIDQD